MDKRPMHWASYGYELAQRLKALRKMRGLSQEMLAELAGLSRNQISNLERNDNNSLAPADPRLSTVYALAQALEVPPVVLLPGATFPVKDRCKSTKVLNVEVAWPDAERSQVRLTHAAEDMAAIDHKQAKRNNAPAKAKKASKATGAAKSTKPTKPAKDAEPHGE
ncbi:helix-turn-helix domain-containing protein [Corynebacterium kozikiae]|uniref:helix-turn-helix domain-containing protein n=1 Tax=Corynebacterium kozikiae TaxID=2968469 RepID=UPI00211C2747|nr:helix-turn-helix transcriptional regulator [Corynebacterium sp. 76QC2CO]MCQ9343151.1 helix-turn-helix domain-containing protein [Corynebacterium sp. 76QC2CO]